MKINFFLKVSSKYIFPIQNDDNGPAARILKVLKMTTS